ncbi:MAG: NAD(P)-binding domain-containing protein [Thermoleophilia bacterium]
MTTVAVLGAGGTMGAAMARNILGTRQPAEEGALVVLASGPEAARERVRPVLDAVGQRTMWVREAGAGTRLKLVTIAWILAVVEGAAESVALAEGLGLDPALLLEAVEGGPLDLPLVRAVARRLAGAAATHGDEDVAATYLASWPDASGAS